MLAGYTVNLCCVNGVATLTSRLKSVPRTTTTVYILVSFECLSQGRVQLHFFPRVRSLIDLRDICFVSHHFYNVMNGLFYALSSVTTVSVFLPYSRNCVRICS